MEFPLQTPFLLPVLPLFSSDNAFNSKSEKRKCGDLAERRSDSGRELRQAVTLFSFFSFAKNFAVVRKTGMSEKGLNFLIGYGIINSKELQNNQR